MPKSQVGGHLALAARPPPPILWAMLAPGGTRTLRGRIAGRLGVITGLGLILALGTYLRFQGLGQRSLGLDELATWHVSRLGFTESLKWGPEAIPPLYQLCIRILISGEHPPEWLLRLPAALAGCLLIVVGWWLGTRLGGLSVGVALALLLACNPKHLEYSREARGYSMLVLGATLSVLAWYGLIVRPTWCRAVLYTIITSLTFYAQVFIALTMIGQVGWWLQCRIRQRSATGTLSILGALATTLLACAPFAAWLVLRQTRLTTVLAWVEPTTLGGAVATLADVVFGYPWLALAVGPAMVVGLAPRTGRKWFSRSPIGNTDDPVARDVCHLLVWWLGTCWVGLLLVSWLIMPVMVLRYMLQAAVPALLLPLVVVQRWHRCGAPMVVAVVALLVLPGLWANRSAPQPGFRELVQFLDTRVDRESDIVAQAVSADDPEFVEMETLEFKYYPLDGMAVQVMTASGAAEVLNDPARIYVVAFLADPMPWIREAGRRIEPFVLDDRGFEQLAFGPYRLMQVAPEQ